MGPSWSSTGARCRPELAEGGRAAPGGAPPRATSPFAPLLGAPRVRRALQIIALAAVYAAFARLSACVALSPGSVSIVWPSSGIALSAILLWGPRLWPGIWLGSILGDASTLLAAAPGRAAFTAIAVSAVIAAGASIQAVVSAAVLRRLTGTEDPFDRLASVVHFLLFSVLACSLISATVGVTGLSLGGFARWSSFGQLWSTWWIGDAIGVLVVTPLVVVYVREPPRFGKLTPTLVVSGVLFAVGEVVFGGWLAAQGARYSIAHVFLPFLVGAVVWLGRHGAALAVFVTSAVATWGTMHGQGPFAIGSREHALLMLQLFTFNLSVTSLALAALLRERRAAEAMLATARDELEERVVARTAELRRANTALEAEIRRRRENEEALRASELRHRALLELSPDAILVCSGERVVYANHAAVGFLGAASVETLVGRRVIDLVHADAHAELQERLRELDAVGKPIPLAEQRIVRLDGATLDVELTGAPIGSYEGKPAVLALLREITARKQVERERARLYREAQESIRARDEFLTIASHELRTPLTALQLQVQALQRLAPEELEQKPRFATSLEVALRQIRRLAKLTDDLLDVSRITQQRLVLERETVELRGIVEEVIARFQPEAARAGCAVALRACAPIAGRWNRSRLDQVVTNLLGNAIKYGAGKPVEITLGTTPGAALLEIRDLGIGISPDDQARIFERFERAVSARHYGGFGLGLWIVRQIVEALGGRIAVTSRAGAGSLFTVELPLSTPEA